MHSQQLSITNTVNAINYIKKAIELLSDDVSDGIDRQEVLDLHSDAIYQINKALIRAYKITVNPGVISFLERSIETLSTRLSEEIIRQEIENINDDVIGFLNAALSWFGYCRYAA